MLVTEDLKKRIWDKSTTFSSQRNEEFGFRKDQCGARIKRSEYGNRNSDYGWEIDHITPVANGGLDNLSNLRALHRENNVAKSDGRLVCKITSKGDKNIRIN